MGPRPSHEWFGRTRQKCGAVLPVGGWHERSWQKAAPLCSSVLLEGAGRKRKVIGENDYRALYDFTTLRDGVMHGRVLFPTYRDFRHFTGRIDNIGAFIDSLDAYNARLATADPAS